MIVFHADCLVAMKTLPDNFVDAIVTDPPYSIQFMNRHWDYELPSVEIWKEAFRVIKPGGHVLCFCGTRTYHRMVVNIEDAGFEIRDMISWIYAQGQPHGIDISKAIDKSGGGSLLHKENKRLKRENNSTDRRNDGTIYSLGYDGSSYEATTDNAKQWEGWNTALKPAQEPICIARKPFSGTVAQNVLQYGTGGINIKDCRIGETKDVPASVSRTKGNVYTGSVDGSLRKETGNEDGHNPNIGRYPSNIIISDEDCVQEEFEKYGNRKSGSIAKGTLDGHSKNRNIYGHYEGVESTKEVVSSDGSAARFFFCAKANKKDRAGSKHPTVKPNALIQYLCKLVTPPNGIVLDPFAGSGSTGEAALDCGFDFILCEKEAEYIEDIKKRLIMHIGENDVVIL